MDGLTRIAALLPTEAPLAMPVRPLGAAAEVVRAAQAQPPGTMACRGFVLLLTLGVTGFAAIEMWDVLGLSRWTVSGVVLTVLFAVLLLPIALSFATASVGFAVLLRRRGAEGPAMPRDRTALLMPVCNEAIGGIEATLAAMRAELHGAGAGAAFDIFVLSDTRDAALAALERDAVLRLRALPGCAIHYRRRTDNEGRKAGNIAEWVRRFGGTYEAFLILDADSEMTAETLLHLVGAMRDDPGVALLQTVPVVQGDATVFARLQAFASRVYGPVLATGAAAWHGVDGNYWGHNALIRTRAFAETCGLPTLPGRKPFGGDILSHDFVEAALLRRAGWGVRMLPTLGGSFEGGPPNLPEMDRRDRRWCQGNLQHAAVIGARGLHPVSRLHLAFGIFSYVASLLWLVFLFLGIAVAVQARFLRPEYFPDTHVLFPQWPVVDAQRAVWMFGATVALLLAPKVLGLLATALSSRLHAWPRLFAGALAEMVLSALLSPVTMMRQAGHVVSVLRGRDSGWQSQCREGGSLPFADAWRFARGGVVLGVVMLVVALSVDPRFAAWMAPVILGLVLGPVLVWGTARGAMAWRRPLSDGRPIVSHGSMRDPSGPVP